MMTYDHWKTTNPDDEFMESKHMTYSHYYGSPRLTNVYARHETWSLLLDLESDKLDADVRVQIEDELARRAAKKKGHPDDDHQGTTDLPVHGLARHRQGIDHCQHGADGRRHRQRQRPTTLLLTSALRVHRAEIIASFLEMALGCEGDMRSVLVEAMTQSVGWRSSSMKRLSKDIERLLHWGMVLQ
jgi:hypothetical protein